MKLLSRMMAVCILCTLWTACSKEEEDPGRTDLLAGSWKWEKSIINNDQPLYPDSAEDYFLHFSKEGRFSFQKDTVVLRSGTFSIRSEPAAITTRAEKTVLKLSDDPGEYFVIIDNTRLILEQFLQYGGGSIKAYYLRQ